MITIRKLSKKFGALQVLSELDLDVFPGETLVILGPSGIGKSVLLKHIIGICEPDSGTIEIDGTPVGFLEKEDQDHSVHRIGMLFQGAALFDSMNVGQNTAFHLTQHGHPDGSPYTQKEIREKVAEALEMVGLAGIEKRMPSELSGGMRKRVALARLIVYRPTIILYDEPTTGLDPIIAMQINELIVKTQKELQATSIVVTHDMFSALYVGNRLSLIRNGKIAYIEEADAFLKIDDPLITFLYNSISKDPRSLKENYHG